jgi:uncharacterized protein YqhQ
MTKLHTIESDATKDSKPDNRKPSAWIYIIGVSVSVVMIVLISRFVFNLVPARSEFVDTEKVANETYQEFSQQLEAISAKSAKEFEATFRENPSLI